MALKRTMQLFCVIVISGCAPHLSLREAIETSIADSDSGILDNTKLLVALREQCKLGNYYACEISEYAKIQTGIHIDFFSETPSHLPPPPNSFASLFFKYEPEIREYTFSQAISPVEASTIRECNIHRKQCKNAGLLMSKSNTPEIGLHFLKIACRENDEYACREIVADFTSLEYPYAFSPDSAIIYANISCHSIDACPLLQEANSKIAKICSANFTLGKERFSSVSQYNCVKTACENFNKQIRTQICAEHAHRAQPIQVLSTQALQCFNGVGHLCRNAAFEIWENYHGDFGSSFHVIYLLQLGCKYGDEESCKQICTFQSNESMIPFNKTLLSELGIQCEP